MEIWRFLKLDANMPKTEHTATPDPVLLRNLVCPLTGGPLTINSKMDTLFSQASKLAYPIRDGIPIMIASEARPMTEAELKKPKQS
jgi:uncharacterized protein YbaR (Trm112 family)